MQLKSTLRKVSSYKSSNSKYYKSNVMLPEKQVVEISDGRNFSLLLDPEFESFKNEPYCLVPRKNEEWYLIVPAWVDLNIGWLYRQTKGYKIFIVNRYVDWISQIPEDIRAELGFKEKEKLIVSGNLLKVPEELRNEVFKRYRSFLSKRKDETSIYIRPQQKFNLIIHLIRDGILPFEMKPVDKSDLQDRVPSFELRDYQQKTVETFLQCGQIGVYWPPSAGKTFFGLFVMSILREKKLIIVPTRTLIEQWSECIEAYTSIEPEEYDLVTYRAWNRVKDSSYVLTIFDEHQHLPANTFSKLAMVKTKYRIGLSATPYREDGRTDLIFALSGFPIGMEWKDLFELKIVKAPSIELIITETYSDKLAELDSLIKYREGRTLVFCDGISLGTQLAKKYMAPFIHGQTRRRMRIFRENDLVICSRVGDEGISLGSLNHAIEVDFLFGSRRQELQRLGRLFHSRFRGRHTILMTEDEFSKYKKRLYGIYEKGFRINVLRYSSQ